MSFLQENEWMLLNDIIYRIHSIENLSEMRKSFLELTNLLIPYDTASFYLASKDKTHLLSDPVAINIDENKLIEYDEYEQIDYTRWIFMSAKSMAYKETDLLSNSERENSKFYSEFYAQHNIHYSIQLSIAYNGVFLGIISLYRPKTDEDFTEKDLFVLNQAKEHLSYRLHKEYLIRTNYANEQIFMPDQNLLTNKFDLTKREIEVLLLILKGSSNQDIADGLYISEHTVKKHLKNIYKKLNVKNRIQLLKFHFE